MRLGKLQRQFAQMHAASLISSVDTTDVRGHVAKHDIDQLIANQRFQLQQHRVLAEVTDDDLDTGNGIKRQNVERQQLSLGTRSEEHTSELQSLMRISYAVFCLKKKNKKTEKKHKH